MHFQKCIIFCCLALSMMLTACGSGGGGGGGGDDSNATEPVVQSIELQTVEREYIANENTLQVAIQAQVKDTNDNPMTGIDVTFSTDYGSFPKYIGSTSGNLLHQRLLAKIPESLSSYFLNTAHAADNTSTLTLTTDDNGKASVTLTLPMNVPQPEVIAKVINQGKTVSSALVIHKATKLIVEVSGDQSIPADGISSTQIKANIFNEEGNPLPGVQVTFSTNNGSLQPTNATTNSKGQAQISLISSNSPGQTQVTAQAEGLSDITRVINFTQSLVKSIKLQSGTTQLEADGKSSTKITAEVFDRNGEHVPDNTRVTFSTTSGSLSAESTLTQQGLATVTYTSPLTVGTATIKASAKGIVKRTSISLISGAVDSIEVSASPNNLNADGESESSLRAQVLDANNNPVANEDVLFSTSSGSLSSARATTNTSGIASVTLTAPGEMPPANAVSITASSANGHSDSTTIALIKALIGSISLKAGTEQLQADGSSSTRITAEVFDRHGNHVPDNTTVSFSTTAGKLSTNTATTSQGIATVRLTSPVNAGTGTITAAAGGILESVSVTFIAGKVTSLQISADPNNLTANGQSTSTIKATAMDASNNPIPNEDIKFSVNHGSLSNLIVTTNSNGRATTIYTTPDSVPNNGQAIIRATSVNNVSSSTIITLISVPVGSISLQTTPAEIPADGNSTANIKATVLDTQGNPIKDGTNISFTTTKGSITPETASTTNGQSQTILTSSTTPGIAIVKATAGGVSSESNVQFTSVATKLSLATSQTRVKTDNSDSAKITATVLNNSNAPIEDITVDFQSTGGKISASSVKTNADGEATITFSSGTSDKRNQVVTVQASTADLIQTIPIQIYGTSLTLSPERTQLGIPNKPSDNLKVRVQDAGYIDIYEAMITAEVPESSPLRLSNGTTSDTTRITALTDVTGEATVKVKGTRVGNGTVAVESLGTGKEQSYSVTSSLTMLQIIAPSEPLVGAKTGKDNGLQILVRSSNSTDKVTFATTSGNFTTNNNSIIDVNNFVANSTYRIWNATLKNNEAGLANVEVYNTNNPSDKDTIQVAFSAPTDQAGQLILQTSASNVQPSLGDVVNTVDLEAQVKTNSTLGDDPVGGAAVLFSISNPTGGGEYISPTLVYTDSSGVAKAVFTSGSLSSGAEGVTVKATLVEDNNINDTSNIIIGGTVGSIAIGYGTKISSVENDTAYALPMSVLVTDSNGNAMSNVQVSLSTWPTQFNIGFWTKQEIVTPEGVEEIFEPLIINTFDNEDKNRNLIRDTGDYNTPDCNNNCTNCYIDDDPQLTPPQSAGGNLPAKVTTDKNGVANFELTYLKQYAIWIIDEIIASAKVLGTETTSRLQIGLPYSTNEKDELANSIPESPFNPKCLDTNSTL